MPQRARTVEMQAIPASIPHEEAVRRVARATDVLLRIAARLDAQKLAAAHNEPAELDYEKSDCPPANEEQSPI